MSKDTQTTKCIRCGKPAKQWAGYIAKRNRREVLAGWCSDRCMHAWGGYHGPYHTKFGEEKV